MMLLTYIEDKFRIFFNTAMHMRNSMAIKVQP